MIYAAYDYGKHLSSAREAKSLSIEEVAHATRMRPAHIEALEKGELNRFPNAAYAKSFLIMYARYLGVNVSEAASAIDTTTQVAVRDFQYLSSRAEDDKEQARASATDPRYDFVAPKRHRHSWLPLVLGGVACLIGGVVFVVWSNLTRIGDQVEPTKETAAAVTKPDPAAAIQPVAPKPAPPATPAPTAAAKTPAATPPPPKPAVVTGPNGIAPVAIPVENSGAIPKARPISPVATIAADDGALLAQIPTTQNAGAAPVSEVSVNKDDADVVLLEPRKKTWVVIRSGPGGQPLYEDYLYPSAKPMRLPPGKYYIELKEADAVAIVRNGKRISYVAPGVLVQ